MNHIPTESLSAYLDHQLSTDQRHQVEQHLSECHVCRDELATLSWSVAFTRAMPRSDVPFGRSFHVPVPAAPAQKDQARRGPRWWSMMAAASLGVAVLVIGIALRQGVGSLTGDDTGRARVAAVAPEMSDAVGEQAAESAVRGNIAPERDETVSDAAAESGGAGSEVAAPAAPGAPPAAVAAQPALAATPAIRADLAARASEIADGVGGGADEPAGPADAAAAAALVTVEAEATRVTERDGAAAGLTGPPNLTAALATETAATPTVAAPRRAVRNPAPAKPPAVRSGPRTAQTLPVQSRRLGPAIWVVVALAALGILQIVRVRRRRGVQ